MSRKYWALVSYDTDSRNIDVWQCDKHGEKIVEEMPDAFEIHKDAIKRPCMMLDNLQDEENYDALGYFVLEAIRLNNRIELAKDDDI